MLSKKKLCLLNKKKFEKFLIIYANLLLTRDIYFLIFNISKTNSKSMFDY